MSQRNTPKRVLVLGCTGMVGRSWMELLESQGIQCVGVSRPEFDLMDPASINRCITNQYDLVVNAAAWTDVDGAEADEAGATRANAHAVDEIARRCNAISATLITYSTDYVFSGDADSPYPVDSPINPINAYGRSKAAGEAMLAASECEHILIRTSWVYAPWGSNFVRTIHGLARNRDELSVVNDQCGRPTSAQGLAKSSLDLYLHGARGVWHMSDGGECTWFDFASAIIEHDGLDCTVKPCSSDQYPRPAARPAYSTLDISASSALIGEPAQWKKALGRVLDSLDD
tara:strand:+ start:335 stop:1195 length:861 start_codon:yes stop_codon:yes gene_type:complete